jgi:GGDEF domain-containing protein
VALWFVPANVPGVEKWSDYPSFHLLPFFLAAISGLLGWLFVQSRLSFLSILTSVIAYLISRAIFIGSETDRAETLVLFASVYFPPLAALFYHLGERGVITFHGAVRLGIVVSAVGMIELLSRIRVLQEALTSGQAPFIFRPVAGWLAIPWIGVLICAVSIPSLFFRRHRESPCLGPLIAIAALCAMAGLNFKSSLWSGGREYAALILFMSASCAVMAWAALESSWRSALIDELTDLPGRRALNFHLAKLGSDYALAILDIDHFKKINDKYGHATGDQVLRYISSQLKHNGVGKAYRAGGEEFVIVSEKLEFDEALAGLDALRQAIKDRSFVIRGMDRPAKKPELEKNPVAAGDRDRISVTVSIGAARTSAKYLTPFDVMAAADKALYRAKKDGRNRVKAAR